MALDDMEEGWGHPQRLCATGPFRDEIWKKLGNNTEALSEKILECFWLQMEPTMHPIEGHQFASPCAPNFPVGENGGFVEEILC